MTTKKRSEDQTAVSVSMEKELLEEIDARAAALGLSRSVYLANLARQDIAKRGPFVLYELHRSELEQQVAADKPAHGKQTASPTGKITSYQKDRKAKAKKPKLGPLPPQNEESTG